MNLPRSVNLALKAGLLALLLIGCLGSEYLHRATLPWPFLNKAQAEVSATFQAADVQWLIVICLSVYFVAFIGLPRSWNREAKLWRDGPMIMGLALYAIGSLAYAFNYEQASSTRDALLLFFGLTLFFGFRFWRAVEARRPQPFNVAGVVVVFTILLLSIAAAWHPESVQSFQYRGQVRWSGLWGNPNTFGMLMSVGVVLAIGGAVLSPKAKSQSLGNSKERLLTPALSPNGAERESVTLAARRWVKVVLFLTAAGLCGLGLVKSYSRGAWLGTACGLVFLLRNCIKLAPHLTPASMNRVVGRDTPCAPPFTPNEPEGGHGVARPTFLLSCSSYLSRLISVWLPVSVILASVFVLAFWNFRHTELRIARRAFSVGNLNDFSWRNRVAAYQGSLQMMAEKPWLGFGWNQPERVYDQFYRAPEVAEGAAIQMNDYLTLGTSLGAPALVCFIAFIGLSFRRGAKRQGRVPVEPEPSAFTLPSSALSFQLSAFSPLPSVLCLSAALVLLVGFWFDAGLFKLATGAVFWILLGLGNDD